VALNTIGINQNNPVEKQNILDHPLNLSTFKIIKIKRYSNKLHEVCGNYNGKHRTPYFFQLIILYFLTFKVK
jgi:hypothetical protein